MNPHNINLRRIEHRIKPKSDLNQKLCEAHIYQFEIISHIDFVIKPI